MIIFPAVDVRGGKAVRLFQGRSDRETVYSDSPLEMGKRWQEQGAKWLHVIDLDGAFAGFSPNLNAIKELVKNVDIPVQLGGGIRSLEAAKKWLQNGVQRLIIGTKALENREFLVALCKHYPKRIVVGVDARDGKVATHGWTYTSEIKATDFLRDLTELDIAAVVFTDITRDGALSGPNLEALQEAIQYSPVPVIASGGVTTVDDVKAIAKLNVEGIIIGTALYDNKISLADAINAVDKPGASKN